MTMLSDRSEELLRLMAQKTGKSPDIVLKEAIEKLARQAGITPLRKHKTAQEKAKAIDEISKRFAARPVLDERAPDDIIGYDEFGVPR